MNSKGQIGHIWLGIIVAIMLFASGMMIVNLIKPEITLFRQAINMDCNNIDISDGAKVTCLGVDLLIPILIVTVVSVAGGYIASKFMV